ncbi:MAG: FecCD transport family protein [Candidatus Nitrotoga sp. SPKER]|nr:MAG: FecCD transport family protein [Candidatus Nitrotoga sp. SPKER]
MLRAEELSRMTGLLYMLPIDWPRRTVKLLGVFLMVAAITSFVLQMSSQARQTLGQIIQTHLTTPQSLTNLLGLTKLPHNTSKMLPPHKPMLVLLVVSLTAAIAISIVGAVSLANLLVPNLVDFLDGATHSRLLAVSVMLVTGYLLLIDYLLRSALSTEIPLAIFPVVIGSSVLVDVWMMWEKRRWF